MSACQRDRARAPLALGVRSRQRVTRQASQGFRDAVCCWQAASAQTRCLDAGLLRLLPPRSALSARLGTPQGASRHKACSSAARHVVLPYCVLNAHLGSDVRDEVCTDCVPHHLTQTLVQPSRRGTAKHCTQGPALCRGRALARSGPTPSTPHAPRAPVLVSSTLLDARSPCTCPPPQHQPLAHGSLHLPRV